MSRFLVLLICCGLHIIPSFSEHLQCTRCAPGEYCFLDNQYICPTHSSSPSGSSNISACICHAGYYSVDNLCYECTRDHYCVGDETRQTCPSNSFSVPGSTQLSDCKCGHGYTGDASSGCTACPTGTYKLLNGSSACESCSANTYSSVTARTSTCDPCPSNTVSPLGSDALADCVSATGYYTSDSSGDIGSTGENVVACPTGTYQPATGMTTCVECGSGFYSTATAATSISTCTACPSHSQVDGSLSGTQLTDCVCILGYTGPDGQACTACTSGTHKDVTGSSPCSDCPINTYSTTQAATSLDTCIGCMSDATSPSSSDNINDCTCDPGFYRSQDTCVSCPDGSIQDGTDDST